MRPARPALARGPVELTARCTQQAEPAGVQHARGWNGQAHPRSAHLLEYCLDAERPVAGKSTSFLRSAPRYVLYAEIFASSLSQGHATASLVVLTTCLRLFALVHDPTSSSGVRTVSSVSIAEPFGRLAEYQDILIDPANTCLVVHAYAGLLRVVPLPTSTSSARRGSRTTMTSTVQTPVGPQLDFSRSYNVRLPILNVSSLAIVASPATRTSILAGIYTEHSGARMLATFAISLKDKDLLDGPVTACVLADAGSELAIPADGAHGAPGILVAGEETISWLSLEEQSGVSTTSSKGKARVAGQLIATCRLPIARVTA